MADAVEGIHEYYEARAPEYDAVYEGRGPASIPDPAAYEREVAQLKGTVRACLSGRVLDLGCGTAFWLPSYAGSCRNLTLLDQSRAMLSQARLRARSVDLADRLEVVCADALTYDFGESRFDSVLVAFLLSHLPPETQQELLSRVHSALRPGGSVLVLDSAWSSARARVRARAGMQARSLANGRRFALYKCYFNPDDLLSLSKKAGMPAQVVHHGDVYIGALCTRKANDRIRD